MVKLTHSERIDTRIAQILHAADAYIDFMVAIREEFPFDIKLNFKGEDNVNISTNKDSLTRAVYVILINLMIILMRRSKKLNFTNAYIWFCLARKFKPELRREVRRDALDSLIEDEWIGICRTEILRKGSPNDFNEICGLLR